MLQEPAAQIAALPYRMTLTGIEIMLISSRDTGRWVIPKGWPMARKHGWEAASIEAYEEAGLEGEISQAPCGTYLYDKRKKSGKLVACQVTVFALHVTKELGKWPEQEERNRKWFSQNEAANLVLEVGLQELINRF